MKKKLVAVLMTALWIILSCACGSSDAPAAETTAPAETKTEETAAAETTATAEAEVSDAEDTITIMVPPITGTYVEKLDTWVKEYQETHPNIQVEVIATSWDEHTSKATTMALGR